MLKYNKIFIILLFLSMNLQAASYYVDKDAFGSNIGTSWADAWTSFSDIDWSLFSPGDVLFLSGGSGSKTYNEKFEIDVNGTLENPIVITKGNSPGHDGEVVLDGQMSVKYGVYISGCEYVTVKGLTVKNYFGSGMFRIRYNTGVIIENNEIYITGHGGVNMHSNTSCIVRNNRMTTPDNTTAQTDGIYSQLNKNNIYENNHIVIYNQHIDPHCDGIQLYVDNNIIIRHNYIEQVNNKPHNAQGIFATDCYGTITTYNNVVYAPNTHNALIMLWLGGQGDANLAAYNNTLVGGGWGTIHVKNAPNSIVKNNVLINYLQDGWTIRISGSNNTEIDYNIHYATNSSELTCYSENSKTWDEWQSLGFEANGLNKNPDLKNITNHEFELSENSGAIDAGSSLSSTYEADRKGVVRPKGNGWDMGAYEYESVLVRPQPPSNLEARIIY
jgi:hypothetical protein